MSDLKIQATKPFTLRVSLDVTSVACNQVVELDSTLANQLITDGLAREYTLVNPTGTKNITTNGEHDVAGYAKVNVAVE